MPRSHSSTRTPSYRPPRALVGLLCAAFVLAMLPWGYRLPAADATVRQPFTPVYSADENGAIAIQGNSQMSCQTSRSGCATARAGSGANALNNEWAMVFLDADTSSQTTNSTSADLSMPAGSTVLHARLVWGGRLTAGDGGTAGGTGYDKVKLRTPGAASYSTITASTVIQPTAIAPLPYQASLDVTSQVSAAGNGTYWVGDIIAGTGEDRYAGWSLVVAYRNPTLPLRNLVVFEGFADVTDGANSSVNVSVSGFLTPATGPVNANVGFVAWEGDLPTTGDAMKFNGSTLSETSRPSDNTFNSNITNLGAQQTDRVPAYPNTLGVDMGRVNANGVLRNNATSTTVNVATSGDHIYLGLLTTEVDLFSPSFVGTSKAVSNLDGNDPAQVGDVLEYTLSFTNTGGDFADALVVRDTLASGITYLPGSLKVTAGPGASTTPKTDGVGDDVGEYVNASRLVRVRLGTGASSTTGGTLAVNASTTVKFRATVQRSASGTTVTNGALLDYRARTLARNYTFTSNTVSTEVGALADVTITKTSSPTTQSAGSAVTYNLTVSNTGPNAATGVVATDTLPSGLSYVSSNPPGGATCGRTGQVVSCAVGTLANGASVVIPITTSINAATPAGSLLDIASVSARTPDDDLSDNTATATTTVTRSADLSVTKTSSSGVLAGRQVTYTAIVRNNGPSTATAATLADSLPVGLTFVTASASSGTCTNVTPTVSCSLGDLAAGATRTVTIVAAVTPGYAASSVVNEATVSSATPDDDAEDNSDAVTTTVARRADVSVRKTASPASPSAGSEVTYTITVENSGPSDARDVALSDAIPNGMSVVRATPSQGSCDIEGDPVTCDLGVLNPDGTASITLVGLIDSDRDPGALANSASVTTSTPQIDTDDDSDTVTSTVVGRADLSLTKVGSPDPAAIGEAVVYTLTVTNPGPSQARQVVVTDTLPDQGALISANGCTVDGRVLTCPVGAIDVGATAEVTIALEVPNDLPEGTRLSNSAEVDAATADPNPADNSATFLSSEALSADLSLTKATNPAPIVPGRQVTYTLIASNAGPSPAQNVQIIDTLPDGITFDSATPEGVCSAAEGTVTCNLGELNGEDTAAVTITADVDEDLTDLVSTNVATVGAQSPPDPTRSNNTASSISTVAPAADLAVDLTAVTEVVRAGETAEYSLVVTNNGPSGAAGVVVTGQVPDGLLPVPGSSGSACTVNDRTVRCVLPATLGSGNSVTIPLRATVKPNTVPATLTGTAYVGSATGDPETENNLDVAELVVVAEADLVATKTADPDPAVAGGTLSYSISATNDGPSDAVDVTLTDTLVEDLTDITASPNLGSCTVTGQTVDCAADRLAPDGELTVLVTARLSTGVGDPIRNTARVGASTPESEGTTDDNSVTTNTPVVRLADLRLTKSVESETVLAGQSLGYALTIYNAGPSDATNVDVEDTLPDGLTFSGGTAPADASCEFFTGFGQCFFSVLPAGESRTIQFDALAAANLPSGTELVNTAAATTSTSVPDPDALTSSVTTTVATRADLAITKTSGTESPIAGAQEEYVLTVVNNGPSTARDVVASDILPDGASFVSALPTGRCDGDDGTVECSLADLAPGAIAVLQITVAVEDDLAGETLTNRAEVDSDTDDANAEDNVAVLEQQVSARNDLTLAKTVTSGPVVAGQPVTYQLRVNNVGPSQARDVQILDLLGPEFGYASSTASGDGSCAYDPKTETVGDDDQVNCSWPVVDVGASRTATLTLTTLATLEVGSSLVNRASATSLAPDPSPAISTSTETVTTTANVGVTKSLLSGLPVAGAEVRWQILVSNAGPSLAQEVQVSDSAATGVAFRSALTPQGSCTVTASEVDCALGTVGSSPVAVTVVADLAADYASANLSNSASVSADTDDPDSDDNVATVTTSATATADLSVSKTANPSPVVAGADVTWQVVLQNAGPSLARDVVLSDALPAGVTLRSAALPGGTCTLASTVTCRLASLASGGSATMTIVGRMSSGFLGSTVSNTASVSASTADADPLDNAATAVSSVARSADLGVTKTGPATVNAGELVTWRLTASNDGPSDASATRVVDTVPAALTDVRGTFPGGSCSLAGTALTCPVGKVPAGNGVVVTVTGRVPADLPAGTLENGAVVSSAVPDPVSTNNSASLTTDVERSAEVALAKVATTAVFTPGSTVAWTLTATNAGPSTAEGVELSDAVPAGVTEVEASLGGEDCLIEDGTIRCPVGVLTPGIPAIVSVRGTLGADVGAGLLSNTAALTTDTPNPTPEDLTATSTTRVGPAADLSVGKDITTGTPVAGAPISFDVVVRSAGPSTSRNVVVTDTMPDQVAIGAVTTAVGACTVTGQDISCALGDLVAGAEVIVTVDGTVDQVFAVAIANQASVSSDTDDPEPSNNQTSATGSVDEASDVAVTMVGQTDASAGEVLEWTLLVTNSGPSNAREVALSDLLPQGVTFVSATADDDSTCSAVVLCDLGTMTPDETVEVTVRGRLGAAYVQPTLVNVAGVTSSSADPNTVNNFARTSTIVAAEADLSVALTVDPTALTPGEDADYELTVSNAGPSTATGVTVRYDLPDGLTLRGVPTVDGADCAVTGRTVACFLALLDPAGTVAIALPVSLAASYTPASLTATASVSGVVVDPDLTNNADSVTTAAEARADLTLDKTGPAEVNAGEAMAWQLTLRNDGPSDAQSVVLTDQLPVGVGAVVTSTSQGSCSQSGRTLSCVVGVLADGAQMSVDLQTLGVLDPSAATGELTNSATVASPTGDEQVDDPDEPTAGRTATVTTEVSSRADVEVYKVPTSLSAVAGGGVAWTVTVVNRGPSTASEVVFRDPEVAGLTGFTVTPPAGVTCDSDNRCPIGDLAPGLDEAAVFDVAADLPDDYADSSVTNTAGATLFTDDPDTTDPDPGDNEARSVLPVTTASGLAIVKELASDAVVPGERVSWTLTVTNAGPSGARSVVVTDTLPAALTAIEVDAPNGVECTLAVRCTLDVLGDDGEVVITVSGLLAEDYDDATLTNTASVTSDQVDPDPTDNDSTSTELVGASADVRLSKVGPDASVEPGAPISWTLRLTNDGPSTARGLSVSDVVPAAVTGVSTSVPEGSPVTCTATGNSLSCALAELDSGDEVEIEVSGTLATDYAGATLVNTANVSSDTADPDPDSNTSTSTTQVAGGADLSLRKSVTPDPIAAGRTATFLLEVSNAGPSSALDTSVVDRLAEGMAVKSVGTSVGACVVTGEDGEGQEVSCDLGNLAPTEDPVRIEINVDVAADFDPDEFANAASVTSSTRDPVTGNNTDQVTGDTETVADLSLTKTTEAEEAEPGDTVEWTLTASNDGPATARSVGISDNLPPGTTLVSAVGTGSTCVTTNGLANCQVGDLEPEETAVITVTATVDADATGDLVNGASVLSRTADPDGGNNVAQALTELDIAADLSLTKSLDTSPVVAGEPVTWTLTVDNAGPATARSVVVTDVLPAGVTWTSSSDQCSATGQTVECLLDEVQVSDEPVKLTITGDLDPAASGPLTNSASVLSSVASDPEDADNEDADAGPITRVADLSVEKEAIEPEPGEAEEGEFGYIVLVTNNGPSTAVGASVVEDLPDGVDLIETDTIQGTYDAASNTFDVGELEPEGIAGLLLIVEAEPGTYVNRVTLESGAYTDPDDSNDTAEATATIEEGEEPSPEPSPEPTDPEPTEEPTREPTQEPTRDPTEAPTSPPADRPRDGLPDTGGPAPWMGVAGVLLVLSGSLLLWRRRGNGSRVTAPGKGHG